LTFEPESVDLRIVIPKFSLRWNLAIGNTRIFTILVYVVELSITTTFKPMAAAQFHSCAETKIKKNFDEISYGNFRDRNISCSKFYPKYTQSTQFFTLITNMLVVSCTDLGFRSYVGSKFKNF